MWLLLALSLPRRTWLTSEGAVSTWPEKTSPVVPSMEMLSPSWRTVLPLVRVRFS